MSCFAWMRRFWLKWIFLASAGLVLLFDTASVQMQWTAFCGKLGQIVRGGGESDPLKIWKDLDYLAINQNIDSLETTFPKDLIKAIAWVESEWRQVDAQGQLFVTVNRGRGKHARDTTLDCGIMQINERMESLNRQVWDWARIQSDPVYNLRAGAAVLESKVQYVHALRHRKNWRTLEARYHLRGHDELDVILKAYNGFQASWSYPNRIRKTLQEKPWEKAILRKYFTEANRPELADWSLLEIGEDQEVRRVLPVFSEPVFFSKPSGVFQLDCPLGLRRELE
jgi:hypothetical protein